MYKIRKYTTLPRNNLINKEILLNNYWIIILKDKMMKLNKNYIELKFNYY